MGDSQRYTLDYSNKIWGSDVEFVAFQAQHVWIRTPWDGHRFVVRGNFGWIETNAFEQVPPELRFFAGEIEVSVALNTKVSHQKIAKVI